MKPFRFAWNGALYSKEDTYTILATIFVSLLALAATGYCLITHYIRNRP